MSISKKFTDGKISVFSLWKKCDIIAKNGMGVEHMSIDVLQEKIRKTKNPSVIDLALKISDLPPHLLAEEGSAAAAYGRFCRELLGSLKGIVPAVRVGFTAFALLGPAGLTELQSVLSAAAAGLRSSPSPVF